jgi:carbamoyl-phosphate synthase small subunit
MEGNYGVALAEREASKIWAQGFVCLELSTKYTEGRSTLLTELAEFKRPALTGVDTRRLTLELRRHGTPWGAIVQALSQDEAIKKATALIKERQQLVSKDWVYEVSVGARQVHKGEGKKGRIAVLDYGAKENILRELKARFSEVAIFNSRATAKEILDWAPNGIMLTNGPGDPSAVETAPTELKKILGQVPIFGICMGHQVLALALGGKTYKLKFGHRGGNHPVKNLHTGEIYMTSQNHGYAVSDDLPSGVKVSHVNLYDDTVEGIEAEKLKAWSVQYHPESAPGPHDARVLFDYFAQRVL